jgi:hypothetical protein
VSLARTQEISVLAENGNATACRTDRDRPPLPELRRKWRFERQVRRGGARLPWREPVARRSAGKSPRALAAIDCSKANGPTAVLSADAPASERRTDILGKYSNGALAAFDEQADRIPFEFLQIEPTSRRDAGCVQRAHRGGQLVLGGPDA